jgi:hypothetical protein
MKTFSEVLFNEPGLAYALTESLDKVAKWKWKSRKPECWWGTFSVAKSKFELEINYMPPHIVGDDNTWELSFSDATRGEKEDWITGEIGSLASSVMATAMAMAVDFIKNNPNEKLRFGAEEPSRKKLYSRIVKRLSSVYNVKEEDIDGDKIYTISKK